MGKAKAAGVGNDREVGWDDKARVRIDERDRIGGE